MSTLRPPPQQHSSFDSSMEPHNTMSGWAGVTPGIDPSPGVLEAEGSWGQHFEARHIRQHGICIVLDCSGLWSRGVGGASQRARHPRDTPERPSPSPGAVSTHPRAADIGFPVSRYIDKPWEYFLGGTP